MAIKPALRTFLAGQTVLTDKVGQRIHLDRLPQHPVKPNVVVIRVSGEQKHDLSGAAELVFTEFDIEVRAETAKEADEIADVIIRQVDTNGLDGRTGTIDTHTDVVSLLDDESDGYEPADDGSDNGAYLRVLTFQLQHGE